MYTISKIASVLNAESFFSEPGTDIEHLLTDSRRLVTPAATLFFALKTSRRTGADYIKELYEAGVRNYVVAKPFDVTLYSLANFIFVDDALLALQQLVAYHRQQYSIPVIGITGSNGKTVVKEWLFQLLQKDEAIVRSPKSYNSQVGVPLSVWQLNDHHSLALFEAGISQKGEMDSLQRMIAPTIGILTNIGEAHSAGFANKEEKLFEKLKLFTKSSLVIYHADDPMIEKQRSTLHGKTFSWGFNGHDLRLTAIHKGINQTMVEAIYQGEATSITIPFADNASIENAVTCWCVLLNRNVEQNIIRARMLKLQPVEMRLQLKHGINNCSIINDSYSNDLSSLNIALEFLQQQSGKQRSTVILSDLGEAGDPAKQYSKVAASLLRHRIDNFIAIGSELVEYSALFNTLPSKFFFRSVEEFRQQYPLIRFRDEMILLKGARVFEFEKLSSLFEQQVHQTVMEVNLSAMVHNLKAYHQYLLPSTKVMAMVKAFSYGSGSAEVASVLQFHKVDYLAVAYADEGVELRKAGISMPIMVMNPEEVTFPLLLQYNLEPEIYSLNVLKSFTNYVLQEGIDQAGIHLKFDTGMHRLGFESNDIHSLILHLKSHKLLVVKSAFTHLVASEDHTHDAFTNQQFELFEVFTRQLQAATGYSFIKHISNSAAIFRHPHLQFDMVRLGIGLYGIDTSAENKLPLQPVATLRTTIAQMRHVKAGETVGYNRRGKLERDSVIATIRIGYADGFSRRLGNGNGHVLVNSQVAKVVGNVCMDMTMIDVTDISNVNEGDAVEVFGPNLPVQQLAAWCGTIPYEIMTNISQRVKRVYYEE